MTVLQSNASRRNWFKRLLASATSHLQCMVGSDLCTEEEKKKLSKALSILQEAFADWDGNWYWIRRNLSRKENNHAR